VQSEDATVKSLNVAFCVLVLPLTACAEEAIVGPKQILLLRHAEKLDDNETSEHLSPAGKERAEAMKNLFEKSKTRPEPFEKPDFIFAGKDKTHSHRPSETIAPLAKHLKLTVNADYGTEDPAKLAKELFENPKYAGKTVLICWRHGSICELAQHLKATDAPKTWKDSTFDRVWQINYENGKATFHDLPQHLMPGDSKK
jgi:hypothetical protein